MQKYFIFFIADDMFFKTRYKEKVQKWTNWFFIKSLCIKTFLNERKHTNMHKNCFIFTLEVFLIITHRSQAPCKILNFIIFTKVMILTLIVFNTRKRKTFGTISIGTIPLKLLDKELAIGQR